MANDKSAIETIDEGLAKIASEMVQIASEGSAFIGEYVERCDQNALSQSTTRPGRHSRKVFADRAYRQGMSVVRQRERLADERMAKLEEARERLMELREGLTAEGRLLAKAAEAETANMERVLAFVKGLPEGVRKKFLKEAR